MEPEPDIYSYLEGDDIKVVDASGERVGKVETVLIDNSGMPAALVVEVDDGFIDLGGNPSAHLLGDKFCAIVRPDVFRRPRVG